MSPHTVTAIRHGLPLLLVLVGLVLLFVVGGEDGFHAWASFTGAAITVDAHGRWPDEPHGSSKSPF